MKFTSKKLAAECLCICIAMIFLSACSPSKADKEAAQAVSIKIAQMSENGFPTLSDTKALDIEYNNLTSKQKDLVDNYGVLQNFLSMDLDAMVVVQDGINSLSDGENIPYSELIAIQVKYDSLASNEQALITGYEKLNNLLALSQHDEAALVAAKFIMSYLKDENSMEITAAYVYDYLSSMSIVAMDYQASNSFGVKVSNSHYILIDTEKMEVDEVFALSASISLNNASASMFEFFDFKSADELDCAKLNANLY